MALINAPAPKPMMSPMVRFDSPRTARKYPISNEAAASPPQQIAAIMSQILIVLLLSIQNSLDELLLRGFEDTIETVQLLGLQCLGHRGAEAASGLPPTLPTGC